MFQHNGIGLRVVEEKDLEVMRELRNSQSTWLWLTSVQQINALQQKQWYEKISSDSSMEYYAIVEVKFEHPIAYEGDFLGVARITDIDLVNRSAMIGLDIKPNFRGKGIGTKAFHAIIEYFFKHRNFHRLHLMVLENNEVAKKLYTTAGFKEEGRQREAIWRNGHWNNYIAMSILEGEYRK